MFVDETVIACKENGYLNMEGTATKIINVNICAGRVLITNAKVYSYTVFTYFHHHILRNVMIGQKSKYLGYSSSWVLRKDPHKFHCSLIIVTTIYNNLKIQ